MAVVVVVGGGRELSIRGKVGRCDCANLLWLAPAISGHDRSPTGVATSVPQQRKVSPMGKKKKTLQGLDPICASILPIVIQASPDLKETLRRSRAGHHLSFLFLDHHPWQGPVHDKLNQRPLPSRLLFYLKATSEPQIPKNS